ncbi:MAG: DUF7146 domain-containing protein [Gammaproteobacteria bacterium]
MSFRELAGRCHGRWPEIIAALSSQVEITDAIERGHLKHGFCPVHGGDNGDGFRILRDFRETGGAVCNTCGTFANGLALLQWLNDWTWAKTAQAVEDYLNGGEKTASHCTERVTEASKPPPDKAPPFKVIRRIWNEGYLLRSPRGEPLRRYLRRRGLSDIQPMPLTLRFHPRMSYTEYGESRPLGHFPCMMASIQGPDGKMVGILRTYLAADGTKASLPKPKKNLRVRDAALSGGAVRLFAPSHVLGVTEGIENALAVRQATGMPVWAAANTALLGNLVVPPGVQRVIIWADNDVIKKGKQAGRIAAEKLADRMGAQGLSVEIRYPKLPAKDKGVDWNDVLLEQGEATFPRVVTEPQPLPTVHSLLRCATG